MGQRTTAAATVVLIAAGLLGCDRRTATTRPSTPRPATPTIASTVPNVTDLLIGMGARDRLVAVSTYDRDRPDVGTLPIAGDYQTADWELLATVRPATLVTFITPDREPAGFRQRAAGLGITLLNVQVNRLADLDPALDRLGAALAEPDLAARAEREIDGRLDRVTRRVAGQPKASALIVLGADGTHLAGPGTYLDDLLQRAGGTNAAAAIGQSWPTIDRETLLSLRPDVILQLMPAAKPQELAQATATWAQLPQVPAVAAGRVFPITDAWAEQPGWHLPDLAERFARCLHPSPPTTAAGR